MTKLHEGNTLSHKPVIDSERSRLHHQLMTVHNDQLYYLGPNGLYSLTYNSKEWKKEADPQFSIESGHSMTSTPHGIVVFGGNVSGKTISDAWIFAVDRWRAFTHDLAPRAYHSCTWIPTMSSVLLSGGSFDHNVYQDFVLLDLKSGKSKTIPLSTPLPFSHHTVTYVSGTQVCLYGGIHANKAENRNMYLIDLSTGEVTIIDSPYLYPARRSHHASLFFGNLFITGGLSQSVVSSDALIYIFEHNVWLNLEFSTSIESSLFVFPMKRGIFFIDETGQNSTVLYYKSNEEPFTGVDDPKYIEFLSSLLDINSKKQKTSPLIMAAQKARRFLSQEKLNMYLEIEKFYHKDILEDTAIAITSHTKEKDTS
ncbi:galactose oxidase [Histomonas meleagridis]|uniref:galactose oxidase n=1 Tax=Histomonas meleagridis TaxID=135588 RepID=UPI003559EB35|nr:galactose oxidase [Histomonas meleagridis]